MGKIELFRAYIQQVLREYVGQGSSLKSDIVLAFHEPLVRKYTEFGVG
jgi:hypothetical protein